LIRRLIARWSYSTVISQWQLSSLDTQADLGILLNVWSRLEPHYLYVALSWTQCNAAAANQGSAFLAGNTDVNLNFTVASYPKTNVEPHVRGGVPFLDQFDLIIPAKRSENDIRSNGFRVALDDRL